MAYWLLRKDGKGFCQGAGDAYCDEPRKTGRACFSCGAAGLRRDLTETRWGRALRRAVELDQAADAGRATPPWGSEPVDVEAAFRVWVGEKRRYERELMEAKSK